MFTALIPIKEHSERIENKNFKKLDNKPLYLYILETLKKSKYVDVIYIDTDSSFLASLNGSLKINIIDRLDYLKGDKVSVNKLIEHDISLIDNDYFLQTHTTNPFLTVETIDNAIECFLNSKNDSLFSVSKVRRRLYTETGIPLNHIPGELIPTQELPILYEENSCLYLFTRESFNEEKKRIGDSPYLYEISGIESLDIDTPYDWEMAEAYILKWRKEQNDANKSRHNRIW